MREIWYWCATEDDFWKITRKRSDSKHNSPRLLFVGSMKYVFFNSLSRITNEINLTKKRLMQLFRASRRRRSVVEHFYMVINKWIVLRIIQFHYYRGLWTDLSLRNACRGSSSKWISATKVHFMYLNHIDEDALVPLFRWERQYQWMFRKTISFNI